jgi:hypothetical protein
MLVIISKKLLIQVVRRGLRLEIEMANIYLILGILGVILRTVGELVLRNTAAGQKVTKEGAGWFIFGILTWAYTPIVIILTAVALWNRIGAAWFGWLSAVALMVWLTNMRSSNFSSPIVIVAKIFSLAPIVYMFYIWAVMTKLL